MEDCDILKHDLTKLQEWEALWQMEFNTSKCHVLSITNRKKPIKASYHLHGEQLQQVNSAKYLGVELSNNLKWDKHIANIIAKANKSSTFLWRSLKACPPRIHVHCYQTFVRPILEYASIVWDPHQKKDIMAVESTQKRVARRIMRDFSRETSATDLVRGLGLEQLCTRRRQDKVVSIHKILHNRLDTKLPCRFNPINTSTRGHNMKHTIPTSRINSHQHSFFPSAMRLWNSLPSDAVETLSLERFKTIVSVCVRY